MSSGRRALFSAIVGPSHLELKIEIQQGAMPRREVSGRSRRRDGNAGTDLRRI
jgi:hypothetical protein